MIPLQEAEHALVVSRGIHIMVLYMLPQQIIQKTLLWEGSKKVLVPTIIFDSVWGQLRKLNDGL